MQFEQMGNLRFYLEQILVGLENGGFRSYVEQVHQESQEYLLTKKRNYSGSAYLEQLENNVVYLAEASSHVIRETAKYVCYGTPRLSAEMVPEYVQDLRSGVFSAVRAHQAFLRSGCTGCEYHAGHVRWGKLKEQRDRGPRAAYVDELEFCLVFYQDLFRVTQSFMVFLLQQQEWAGAGTSLPINEVFNEIGRRVEFRIQVATGNVTKVPANQVEIAEPKTVSVAAQPEATQGDASGTPDRQPAPTASRSITSQGPVTKRPEEKDEKTQGGGSFFRRIMDTLSSSK